MSKTFSEKREEKKNENLGIKTYTEKEIENLLKEQIVECAKTIDADNMSVYTARRKIYKTKLVKL